MKTFRYIAVAAALLTLGACTDPDGAVKALEAAGYTSIRVTGYSWFACGRDDGWATGFSATGANRQPVTGVVCGGLLKGNTIRTF